MAAVAARVPGAQLVVQLDEPSVPAVLQGGLPTATGFGHLSAVPAEDVERELRAVVEALPVPVVVHCCAPRMPLTLFRSAGAAGLSFDLSLVQDLDAVGEAVDAGVHLLVGVVPGTDARAAGGDGHGVAGAGLVARARLLRRAAARGRHAHAVLRPGRRHARLRAERR